jgi:hypothetical protein
MKKEKNESLHRSDEINRSVFVLYAARFGGKGRASDA